jgi:hypothetical protein
MAEAFTWGGGGGGGNGNLAVLGFLESLPLDFTLAKCILIMLLNLVMQLEDLESDSPR